MSQSNNKILLKENIGTFLSVFICIVIVFLTYFKSLDRHWIFYDERVIYEELYAPIPSSFGEIIEVINSFGLTNNISSSNYLYSSNTVNRSNLFGIPLLLIMGFFFKKNVVLYHSLNLFLHLLNTIMVFFILKKSFLSNKFLSLFTTPILALIWALHPVQVESILLSTNIGATLSYFMFFVLFYDFISNRKKNNSIIRILILPICFLLPMFLNEYIIALPGILFSYSFIENYKENSFVKTFKLSCKECFPYILGTLIYLVYFLFSTYKFIQPASYNQLILFTERIFWLAPQIFFHCLKLIFVPIYLSIDQSQLIHLGNSVFDIYPISCFLLMFLWIFTPITLFLIRRHFYTTTLLTLLFFISLIPFIQILSPTYALAAERYLYTPTFILIFGIVKILNDLFSIQNTKSFISIIIIFTLILFLLGDRTCLRIKDWNNNYTLLKSTIKSSNDLIYTGERTATLGNLLLKENKKSEAEKYFSKSRKDFYKAIDVLKEKRKEKANQPLIFKAYGLDYDSQILKAAYFICLNNFLQNKINPEINLSFLKVYIKNLENLDARTLELYANLLVKNNNLIEAKRIFELAYRKFPTSPFILVSLIRFEKDIENDLPNAKKYLNEALTLYPYSLDILYEALSYYQAENNLQEYAKYSYLYGLRTHLPFFYREALVGFLNIGDLTLAKKITDKLLQLDATNPDSLFLASNYYTKIKDFVKAIELLNKAYLLGEKNTDNNSLLFNITYNLSIIYHALSNTEQAKLFAQKALKYSPNGKNLQNIKELVLILGK